MLLTWTPTTGHCWDSLKSRLLGGRLLVPESRRDQEEGGEQDCHEEVRLSFAGPGEIKRREVSRTVTKKLDFHLRALARSRGGR